MDLIDVIDVDVLARTLGLGALLQHLRTHHGGYQLIDQWAQGEFHHDVVVRTARQVIVVATNCNGGVKEVLCLGERPGRSALWHARCPANPEFTGDLPAVLDSAMTVHWFDPCGLLQADARPNAGRINFDRCEPCRT